MKGKLYLFFIIYSLITSGFILAEEPVNYPSGSYNENIFLNVNNLENKKIIKYSFIKEDPEPEIDFREGLLLSALPGEERTYNISFKIDNELFSYKYRIDKKEPSTPQASLIINEVNEPGYSFSDYVPGDNRIFYGYDDYKKGETFLWNGELIPAPKTGLIYYFAVDNAGNKSPVSIILPEESPAATGRVNLQVKSPVEGDFANTQLLYIEKQGFEWIKYSLNGTDPEISGSLYTEPVEIRRYGNVFLRISAKPLNSNRIITREINYRVNTKAPLKNIPPSGIYSTTVNIESRLSGYRYCLEERSTETTDPYFNSELNINPVYGGVKYTVVRISNPDEKELGDFRYYYIIDDRYPANPIINFFNRLPEENVIDVNIDGPVYSDIYYTLDGSSPGKSSELYKNRFSIEVPEDKNAGSIIIKARALSLNGKPSNTVSKIFTYDTKKPEVPEVSIIFNKDTGLYNIDYELNEDEQLIYYVSNTEIPEIISTDEFSSISKSDFFLDIPVGSSREFNFIFAALDSAGNISDFSIPQKIFIDKKIPEKPLISFENGILIIESDYHIIYKYDILKNGILIASEKSDYLEPLNLTEKVLPGCTLQVSVELTDDFGNTMNTESKLYLPVEVSENKAVLFSRKSEDMYSGSEIAFYAYPDGIDDELFYYLTEYNQEGTPVTSGPFETDGYITINGEENSKKDYYLEVYSINKFTKKKSKINTYEFTIDNKIPERPHIVGLKNGSVVGDRVILNGAGDGDSILFLNYSKNLETIGDLFSKSSIIFNKPLTFDVEAGTQQDFYLKIGAGDSAGNSVVNDEIFSFTIDKTPPVISSIEYNVVSSGVNSFNLKIKGEEGVNYYYENGLCGTIIKNPSRDSAFFTDKLILEGDDGRDRSYILKILAIDAVGNKAEYPLSIMYRIDNKKPEIPVEPRMLVKDKNKKVMLLWEKYTEDIIYQIAFDNEEYGQLYNYGYPVSIKYTGENKKLKIQYFAVDEAGNRSEISSKSINLPSSVYTDLIQGIENNKFYKNNLELRAVNDSQIIRYEISTDQILPMSVSVFSPVLPDVLPFRIEEGESINFVVSLKQFEDENDTVGGAEQILRFTIDKQIPEPPVIEGIKDGEYYLSDCTASFKASGDSIYYSIDNGSGKEDVFSKYNDSIKIETPEGTYRSYKIKAYSEDFSGNKSAIREWGITIDKEIIYVSGEGKDYFEGTRSKPFFSLNKALEQVKNSDRKTLFIQEGVYELNSPGIIDESVTIYGGFKKGSWQDKTGKTEILINKKFPEDNPAFYIYGGNLTVENLIINSGQEVANAVFFVNKGVLNIRNSFVNCESGKKASFLKQNYGKLLINNTTVKGIVSDIPFISNDYGIVSISNSSFDIISGFSDSTVLNAVNCSEYSINSSDFMVSGGQNIKALSFTNSDVRLKSDIIKTNNANIGSTYIESVNSRINMTYCRLEGSDNNRITRAFISEDSILDFNGNTFKLDAVAGVIGFNITGGSSIFSNNNISTDKCNDFIYLFLFNSGKHDIETNIFDINSADDIVAVRAKGSELDFLNNTVHVGSSKNNTIMFLPETDSVNRIINNIFININTSADNIMIHNTTDDSMISFINNCSWGWDSYLSGNIKADSLISLDLVDGIYSGGRFSGNIEEDPEDTFAEDNLYKISPESKCIDSGYDLTNIIKKNTDFDGERRPNRDLNPRVFFDIGADEYYQ